jgi:hypothetical protein
VAWFDCAVRRPIGANTGGILSPNLGLVLHHAVANGSLWSFFNNPSAQVSAHFWVSLGGVIEQYVDTSVVAWHGRQLNSRYVGVETEGCQQPPYAQPMSAAMFDALTRLYAEGAARHGWANALANADGQRGFGYHRMAVNTACPCDVRLEQRSPILARAFGAPVPGPEPEPPSPPPEEDDVLLAQTFSFNGMLQCFYVTKSFGELWHKWSSDNGLNWYSETLMGAGAQRAGYVQTAKLIECAAPQGPLDEVAIVTVYAEDNQVWQCRQTKGQTTWDRRRI